MKKKSCLLIGNTRWHWSIKSSNQWDFIHSLPEEIDHHLEEYLICNWAAVGTVPSNICLDSNARLSNSDIPLLNLPNWVGIDRALGSWRAFKKAKEMGVHKEGILMADAGTVLSITRVNSKGEFAGGQLLPGLNLQCISMENQTLNLLHPGDRFIPSLHFPFLTNEAILRGTFHCLIGSLIEAQRITNAPIFLCGGDSPILFNELKERNIELYHYPNLVLEEMIEMIDN